MGEVELSDADPHFYPSDVLQGRWTIFKKLKHGKTCQVYKARDNKLNKVVAIKTELKQHVPGFLRLEFAMLQDAKHCKYLPYISTSGNTDVCRYIVMEYLPLTLDQFVEKSGGRLSLQDTTLFAIEAIKAIQAVHEVGYIHRDVKPSHFGFTVHPTTVATNVLMCGLLLCRSHIKDGKPRNRRTLPQGFNFKGTLRYASLNSHKNLDLGRMDDLVSLFYTIVEISGTVLPWKDLTNKDEVMECKDTTPVEQLCSNLPNQFATMGKAVQMGEYHSQPKYDKLIDLFVSVLKKKLNVDPVETPFDVPELEGKVYDTYCGMYVYVDESNI